MIPDNTENINDPIGLLTLEQAARLLHVHSNTLRRWSDTGKIRTLRINARGDRRFRMQDIEQYLETLNHDTKKISKK